MSAENSESIAKACSRVGVADAQSFLRGQAEHPDFPLVAIVLHLKGRLSGGVEIKDSGERRHNLRGR